MLPKMQMFRAFLMMALALAAGSGQGGSGSAFALLKELAGTWEADSPAGGKLSANIVLVSKGTAIEETIGTPQDNEVSLYTLQGGRTLMTHYCAMTVPGHQVRLESTVPPGKPREFTFTFMSATNLASPADPHMTRMILRPVDADHFTEMWTKTEKGKDTVFNLNFTRTAAPRK